MEETLMVSEEFASTNVPPDSDPLAFAQLGVFPSVEYATRTPAVLDTTLTRAAPPKVPLGGTKEGASAWRVKSSERTSLDPRPWTHLISLSCTDLSRTSVAVPSRAWGRCRAWAMSVWRWSDGEGRCGMEVMVERGAMAMLRDGDDG